MKQVRQITVELFDRDGNRRPLRDVRGDVMEMAIEAALEDHLWSPSGTALALGTSRKSLYRMVEKYLKVQLGARRAA